MKQLFGSQGTDNSSPFVEFLTFIVWWAFGSILFLSILAIGAVGIYKLVSFLNGI